MAEILARENIEDGRVALVYNFKISSDTYLDSNITEEDPVILLDISDNVISVKINSLVEEELHRVSVSSKSEGKICNLCGAKSMSAVEANVFTSGLLDTISQTDPDQKVVALGGQETKYHCKSCFEDIRDRLEYHVKNGKISSELTIRNL